VTYRKQIEEELRYQSTLLARLNDAVVASDAEYRITAWNAAAESMYGWKASEVLGRNGLAVMRTEWPAVAAAKMRRLIARQGSWRGEATQIRKDGTRFPVDVSSIVLRDGRGRITGYLSVNRGSTERKWLEESLANERNLYRDLVNSQPAGVYRVRVSGRSGGTGDSDNALWRRLTFELTSDTFCRVLGVTQGQCRKDVGVISKRIHPEDRDRFVQANADGIASLETFNWDGRICKGKEVRWVHFTSVPRPASNGAVVWTGIVTDITERKRLEETLRESETRYRSLFEQAADSIVVFDPKTTKILEFNDAACQRLGYTRDEFAQLRIADLDVIETHADVVSHGHRVVTKGHRVFETKHKTKGGTVIDVEVWPQAITLQGKTVILGIWRDITERKRLEAHLKVMNEKLEAKVAERTAKLRVMASEATQAVHAERKRIAYILHEDLQQRLAAMKYHLHGLRQTQGGGRVSETADKLLRELDEALRLTRTLTRRLTPPMLYESGLRPSLEWLAHDLGQGQGVVIRLTGRRDFRLASDDLHAFAFDAVRELLLNVVKHAGVDRAEIHIRTAGKNRIAVGVIDQGKGCAVIQETAGSFGLFSIRERAQAMGADFEMESAPGKGTRATLLLPTR
jgi:PAS domain S-box-containing protein